jgi:ketosteroid isomerase-like protein
MKLLLTLLTTLTLLTAFAQNKDIQAIRKILANQTIQWNKGNIEAFMNGYWKSDSLLFVGKSGPKYGYREALANYKKGYPDTATMGKLAFDILKIQSLSPNTYFVLGKWMLKRSIGDVSGYYTLLFRKINNQWVIAVDHSS